MERIKATDMRKLADDSKNEYGVIAKLIQVEAEMKKTELHVYQHVKEIVLIMLEEDGFEVIRQPSIAIQKDNLYYTVRW